MKVKFGKREIEWPTKAYIQIFNILLDNPDIDDRDRQKVV